MPAITPTTDLDQFVGRTANVTFILNGNPLHNGICHATVVIIDVEHGATASSQFPSLRDGVRGLAAFYNDGGVVTGQSYFFWPYGGLHIEAATGR